jgi:hypothetical protein
MFKLKCAQYDRKGRPKMTTLKYNPETNALEWSAPMTGASMRMLLGGGGSSKEKPSTIALDGVKEVCRGVQTEVLLKAGLLDPTCCLSVLAEERVLNLAFSTPADRDSAFKCLQALLGGKQVKFSL